MHLLFNNEHIRYMDRYDEKRKKTKYWKIQFMSFIYFVCVYCSYLKHFVEKRYDYFIAKIYLWK